MSLISGGGGGAASTPPYLFEVFLDKVQVESLRYQSLSTGSQDAPQVSGFSACMCVACSSNLCCDPPVALTCKPSPRCLLLS